MFVVEQKTAAAAAAAAAGTVSNTAAPIMLHQVDPINALQNLARNGLGPQQGEFGE